MNKFRLTIQMLAIAAFTFAFASMAQAQATRTWVSGVGDDVNPCSRTAPCKTFAGAISKTADKGEIDCLDPGGFGTVTITKNITIDGTQGAGFGSILAAGTNGVNVNDSASGSPNTIVVSLRNLSIQGAGTGFDGIRFTSGKEVNVENCIIAGFKGNGANSDGIDISLTAAATGGQRVHVTDTIIRDTTGTGIRASNSVGTVNVTLDNVRISDCSGSGGVSASTNSKWNIRNSTSNNNSGSGIEVLSGAAGLDLDNCGMQGNVSGLAVAASTTIISNCRITNNTNGINFVGGVVSSYGDNKIQGNTNNQIGGSVTALPPPAKV
jgi:hypothetical protein